MALVVYQGNGSIPTEEEDVSSAPVLVGKKFVGLANQGATCYLNGLLQTLFMTPEFRKAIFSWNYNAEKDGSEEFCIPLQLQRLFGLLQLSKTRAVDTVALTKSFGWEGSEVFQQQDVQELTRVLFDALEETFKGTPAETVIDDLYAGELIDYIRCIDVDYQSERIDKFLDFSLAIVPFGETKAMKSLAECIEMFLRPEILDGDNKYFCEKYNQKVDAIKGLKFGRLPQIMSVQLKRFVYDFSGDYVVQKKLNDQVKFPMVLDMNKYIAKKSVTEEGGNVTDIVNEDFEAFLREQMSKLKKSSSSDGAAATDAVTTAAAAAVTTSSSTIAGPALFCDVDLEDATRDPEVPPLVSVDDNNNLASTVTTSSDEAADAAVFYGSMSDGEIEEMIRQRGEWVYELYAVLIHSGSVTGGHYYAYIKDLESKKWYNFNDSSVLPINEKDVEEAWGGKSLYAASSSYYNLYGTSKTTSYSSANAYMLMYRKVGIASSPQVPDEIIPQYIRDMVAAEEEKRLARQKEEEEFRNRLRIRVHWDNKENYVVVKRNNTVKEALETIWDELKLSEHFKTNNDNEATDGEKKDEKRIDLIRLREYNHITKLRAGAYDIEKSAEKRLSDFYFNEYKHYIVETRKPDEAWEEYYTDGISVLMEEFDAVTQTFKEPITIRLPKGSTLGDFKAKIAGIISFNVENALVSKIVPLAYNDGRQDILAVDALRLREDYTVYEGGKLVVEDKSADPNANQSLAYRAFLNAKNKIEIHFNIPPSTEFLQSMMIDGRWKIKEFRQRVADLVHLPVEECRMFKLNIKGNELKDSDISLTNAGVYAHMNLLVVRGKPTPPLFYPISLFKYTARDYVPGATELPGEDPLDINSGIENVDIEVVQLDDQHKDATVDPWTVAVDDAYMGTSATAGSGAMNPYQKKIPKEYEMHSLATIRETPGGVVSSNHSDLEQIIDDPAAISDSNGIVEDMDADMQMAIALAAMDDEEAILGPQHHSTKVEEINDEDDDAASDKCNGGDFENEQNLVVEDMTENEDDLLLKEAEIVTATYPSADELVRLKSEDQDMSAVATARPILKVERSISREHSSEQARSRSNSNNVSSNNAPAMLATPTREKVVHHKDEVFTTPKSLRSAVPKSFEAEDADVMEAAHRRVLHLSELENRAQQRLHQQQDVTNSYAHPSTSKLQPLDLAVIEKNYVTTNPLNPFKSDLMDDDLEATIAAIDAAVERANQEAAAKAASAAEPDDAATATSPDAGESTPAAVVAEEISDFGERMVKNLILPEQFQEIVNLNGLYVGPSTPVAELRKQIYAELLRQGVIDANVTLHQIRLREKIGHFPAKILRDGKTLQESSVYLNDHKAFCIEVLPEEEHLPEDDHGDVVVQVQKWHRSSWSLSDKIDVLLSGGKMVRDIAKGLCKLFQIPFEHIRILVIPRDSSLMMSDLALTTPTYSRSWFDPRHEKRLLRYMSYDMRLVEGDLLLLQDASEPLMELSPADRRSIMLVQSAQDNPSVIYADNGTSYSSYPGGGSSSKIPSWVLSNTSSSTKTYQYPALRSTSTSTSTGTGTASASSGSNGIRIKTQKDRQREAQEGSTANSNNNNNKSSAGTTPSVGRTSPVDLLTGTADTHSIAVGTEDDFFLTSSGNNNGVMRGRYADDVEYLRQGGAALFSDLD